ncbi:MAG: hypothetical protein R2844_19785 [Caldilineales bacterium]
MRLTFTLSGRAVGGQRPGRRHGWPAAGGATGRGPAGQTHRRRQLDRGGQLGRPSIRPISLERHVFCGRIGEVETWQDGNDTLCQATLDCGVPLRSARWRPHPRDALRPATGTSGWQPRGLLAMNLSDSFWQTITGSIVDIQRLSLDPLGAGFGNMHWLSGLPRQSFAPDQVYVTVEVGSR